MVDINLVDLPTEVLVKIVHHVECEFGWKNKTLHYRQQVAATCRALRAIATPILYSVFEYDHDCESDILSDHKRPLLFARSLAHDRKLLLHLRTLSLVRWDSLFLHIDANQNLFSGTSDSMNNLNRLGQLLLPPESKLKNLDIDYPMGCSFLKISLPKLKRVEIRPIGGAGFGGGMRRVGYPLSGYLNVDFLPYLLQSPKLEYMDLSSVHIIEDDMIRQASIAPKSSSLKHLRMYVGNFDDAALLRLLEAPEGLISFDFHPTTECELASGSGSDPASLPRISTIGKALRAQAGSLQRVSLSRGNWFWHPNLDNLGSLENLSNLKELKLNATMLVGWEHCHHHRTEDKVVSGSTWGLAKLLPNNLERLELVLDDHHWHRNGSSYVLSLVQGLEAAQQRLWKLKHVKIGLGFMPYCGKCDEHIGMDERRTNISFKEIEAVRKVVKNCRFEFTWQPKYLFWDEEDGKAAHEPMPGVDEWATYEDVESPEQMWGWN
ncbi:hypothetical protein H2198_000427 [Neophaeococcomyces mojaviensis]|uniref:Uncharacterized protein n=1 Tax=Neophaeococcomyces mojaviensis TaxID=3383035 RepID=A0ACC3AK11_9EURO|nr:hypothetical protein H2198_000427 [Knufia sp. JES_112]